MSTLRDVTRSLIRIFTNPFDFTILSGINRGRHWRVKAGVIACWLGTYERHEAALIAALIPPGGVVFDVGAHAGYYTLAASRLVGPAGRVVSFEPDATNLRYLQDHLTRNWIDNVIVVPRPVGGEHDKVVSFVENVDHRYESGLSAIATSGSQTGGSQTGGHQTGGHQMKLVNLDRVIAEGLPAPDVVKMDIEGGESAAIEGAPQLVGRLATAWLISTHGAANVLNLVPLFRRAGYNVHDVQDGRLLGEEVQLPIYSILALPPGRDFPKV